ncbi:SufD family Fe-S cluster assembly protein [Sulfurimonas sp.]|nr:SufD family Fe-S cluster assembly protein [Sulfurimonas sp.]
MSCTAREYLSGLNNFNRFHSNKEEAWRFSKLNKWLDKEYKNQTSTINKVSLPINASNKITIHNGQIDSKELSDNITVDIKDTKLDSTLNPYLEIIKDINQSTISLTFESNINTPILIHHTYDEGCVLASSLEIHLEKSLHIDILEYFEGAKDSFVLHSNTLHVGSKSSLHLSSIQNLDMSAFFLTHTRQTINKHSNLKEFILFNGASFHQHFLESNLYQSSTRELNVLINSKKEQKHLLSTTLTHVEENTSSFQRAKELLRGSSMALFDARCIILNGASGSDVRQENRALLLSKHAHLHAKPHLEIFTEELTASHGATVGELDIEALNYLKSRGIKENKAHKILTDAFVDDILGTLDNDDYMQVVKGLLEEENNHEKL